MEPQQDRRKWLKVENQAFGAAVYPPGITVRRAAGPTQIGRLSWRRRRKRNRAERSYRIASIAASSPLDVMFAG